MEQGWVLETKRLYLREQTLDDLDDMAEILCDAETMRFYPKPFTRDDARAWIERNMRNYADLGHSLWGMVRKDSGEFIGQCGLWPQTIDDRPEIEIGWHVKRRHWRQGYASEAAAASRDHGLGTLGLERVVSLILPANVPSQGVARKIGMTPRKDVIHAGLPHLVFARHRSRAAN
jgi:ribosomal-protein-alanine N-acetyltransferase